ncbi:hypothetical protein HELRODRAFT_68024 [Helobdella robusta]|uniref:CHORD domain-containing protein n=1 Tax=Helobdella robusta TaxID=6412 RepID=T1FZ93_HELRO|nr:hypothetical protein HELRODRAFT_68024 [Helobdella robusta]ESN96302.1 hypothetical protein HELRODRAFT_68024 [Helobdella robusta]
MEELLTCYNKGCGMKFKASENKEDSCRFHPGGPIFHDALKGWSCCKKRSTDFTEFLNIPGCTTGFHSNVKPIVESAPTIKEMVPEVTEDFKQVTIKPLQPVERPSSDEQLVTLQINVADAVRETLKKELSKLELKDKGDEAESTGIPKGTSCKNNGCTTTYEDESSDYGICVYHTGVPVFHEGMKYWSCCQIKTTDFNSFLNQSGCATGQHLWIKKDEEKKVACRLDWHQTPSHVTITIFSKLTSPEKTKVEVNGVRCCIHIVFDVGRSVFDKDILLKGIIDPSKSSVKILASKVEINLKKQEPGSWAGLEL